MGRLENLRLQIEYLTLAETTVVGKIKYCLLNRNNYGSSGSI